MDEPKQVGEFYSDWREHFQSLESIAEMTDVNILVVGSNSEKPEQFPADVLVHLPNLRAFYLRNFEIDFTHFGGHLAREIGVIEFWDVEVKGNWYAHWEKPQSLARVGLKNCTIAECEIGSRQMPLIQYEEFWRLGLEKSTVPSCFFPHLVERAINLDNLYLVSTQGFSLKMFETILNRQKLQSLTLDGLNISREWLVAMQECETLNSVNIINNGQIGLNDFLLLAQLPKTSLKYLRCDYKRESRLSVDAFIAKWREIKRTKLGVEDESSPHPSTLPE